MTPNLIEANKFTRSIYKADQEPLQRETNTTTRGHSHKLKKERCNTRTRANFFRHRITNRWNNLCDDVVTAPCLNSFKSRHDHQWCAYQYSNNNDFPQCASTSEQCRTAKRRTAYQRRRGRVLRAQPFAKFRDNRR